jgi:hypothetical protein
VRCLDHLSGGDPGLPLPFYNHLLMTVAPLPHTAQEPHHPCPTLGRHAHCQLQAVPSMCGPAGHSSLPGAHLRPGQNSWGKK